MNEEAVQTLASEVAGLPQSYEQIVFINSIGYCCDHTDPAVVPLADLAHRVPDSPPARYHGIFSKAFPDAALVVCNRAKAPQSKRSVYPQLLNDFSVALTKGIGLPGEVGDFVPDAIVDWGGSSYKVYVDGKRIGTELLDANELLCHGDLLHKDRVPLLIDKIKLYVQAIASSARRSLSPRPGRLESSRLQARPHDNI